MVRVEIGVEIVFVVVFVVEVEIVVKVGIEVVLKQEDTMSRTIEVSEETYNKIKSLEQLGEDSYEEIQALQDMIGEKFFFRTVTYHLTGRVKKVIGNILELEGAAWIADSGRFMNAIKEGTLKEVEPVGRAYINIQAVTDFFPWKHPLPSKQI